MALEALKSRRSGLSSSTRTEEYEIAEEETVYDVVDENEYRQLVEKRREREDFVVDDGELYLFVRYSMDRVALISL